MLSSNSHYTGGNNGWGTLVYECDLCGAPVAEFNVDENGIPTDPIFDYTDDPVCPFCGI